MNRQPRRPRICLTAGFLAVMVGLSLTLSVSSQAQKPVLIKLATLAPEGSSWIKTFRALASEISKKTENKVQIRLYPGGVLGDEADMLRKMQIGQIQGAALTSGGLSSVNKEIDVLQVPFFFQNDAEVDHILNKMDAFFRKGFEENGYVLLGWAEAGFVNLMSTVPVQTVNDMKRAKVWIWEGASMSKVIFDEMGVKAIPLTVPDVLVGLQTGLVEVVYGPPSGALALQWFTKIKYLMDVPLVYVAGGVVVRKDTFRQIAPGHQELLLEAFERHLNPLKGVTRRENRDAIQVMAKHGVKIILPTRPQIEEFRKLADRAMAHPGSKSFSKQVFDEVSSLLAGYRKEGR